MSALTLLGPQRLVPTLAGEVAELGIDGPIAVITAGWQEREAEAEELAQHLDRPVVDMNLHRRCEEVFAEDRQLFAAHRERQDELRALQSLYRERLDHTLAAARALLAREAGETAKGAAIGRWLEAERASAIAAVRTLDDEHTARIRSVHRAFRRRWRPWCRPAIERHRDELAALIERASAVAVAGGHVAVLLNRMRLFELQRMLRGKTVIAWSAGAMALSERVVLFHDTPPQGAGNSEVLELGLGLYRGIVALPHASRRLRLGDPRRVQLMARRFAPARCVPLDERSALYRAGGRWRPGPGLRVLGVDGTVGPFAGGAGREAGA